MCVTRPVIQPYSTAPLTLRARSIAAIAGTMAIHARIHRSKFGAARNHSTPPAAASRMRVLGAERRCWGAGPALMLLTRVVLALDVTLELRPVEVHVAQITRRVPFCLIVEVRRRRIAALAARGHRARPHAIAEFHDG